MYKYAVQNLHRKQVHVSSVPRHCVHQYIKSNGRRDRNLVYSPTRVLKEHIPPPGHTVSQIPVHCWVPGHIPDNSPLVDHCWGTSGISVGPPKATIQIAFHRQTDIGCWSQGWQILPTLGRRWLANHYSGLISPHLSPTCTTPSLIKITGMNLYLYHTRKPW